MGSRASALPPLDTDLPLGRVTVLMGADQGKYPDANSLLVNGSLEGVLIDPSLSVSHRGGAPARVDRLLISHAHEDHMAGVHVFPDARVHAHHDDLLGVHSLAGFLSVYGMPPAMEAEWKPQLLDQFHYTPRPDAAGFADGARFDLGGVAVEVVHLPGHTRGHCGFVVEPEGLFFVADIDLSSFGPYYGDHWSNLDDFERSIERCREIDARWYVTAHHKGIIEGRAAFVSALDAFAAVVGRRDAAMLAFLREPRTIDDMIEHRFIYRRDTKVLWADHVERTAITMHLERLERVGAIERIPHDDADIARPSTTTAMPPPLEPSGRTPHDRAGPVPVWRTIAA